MSFLDEQATGQIGIGEKANLSTLTRRKRKRKKGQNPTGAETYSLMPQDEFSNIVSSPTDIQQVGIGNLLQAQSSSAGEVPNVFEQYDSAAPLLGTKEAVYYQPPPEDEDDDDDDDDLPSVENDPYIQDPGDPTNPGFTTDDGQVGTGDKDFESATAMLESVFNAARNAAAVFTGQETTAFQNAGYEPPDGKGDSVDSIPGDSDGDNVIGVGDDFLNYTAPAPPTTPVTPVTPVAPVTPYDPGSFGAPDAPSGGSDISIPGYSGSTSDFGLD